MSVFASSNARRVFLLAALAAPLATASTARADDVSDQAELEFSLGAESYQRADYRTALQHFLMSNRLVPNKNVVFNIARSYEQLKSYPEAFRYYSVALDTETEAPARARLQSAIAQVKAFVTVLRVDSTPRGATLYVDRRDLGARGVTPIVLGLTPRAYRVILEHPGYEPATAEVPATMAGQEVSLALSLKPILGRLLLRGPRGARASFEGEPEIAACDLPCTLDLPVGSHTATISRPGFRSEELPVLVQAHAETRVVAQLEPILGSLLVSSDEPSALVSVDGTARGFTPAILSLPVGPHEVRVSLKGFRSQRATVTVRAEAETRLELTLVEADEVVAASRAREQVVDAPSSVTLVPERELLAFATPTVAEAVRGVPGVYLSDDRSYVTLGVRGLGRLGSYGNRLLVTYDGQPMNDDWIGSSYVGYDALCDLGDVERIEVLRGPGSVLYGTNALSGVINVVSRSDVAPGVSAGVSTNQNGVARVRSRVDLKLGKDAGGWASVGLLRGHGRDFRFAEFVNEAEPSGAVAHDVDGFDAKTFRGRAYYRFISAQWSLHSYEKHLPTTEYGTLFGDARAKQTDTRDYVELRAEPPISESVSTLTRLHWNRYTFRGTYPRAPRDGGLEVDTYHGSWLGLEQRVQFAPSARLKLTFGGEGQLHYQVEQRGRDEDRVFLDDTGSRSRPFQVGALYALLDASLGARAHLSLGTRLDAYSTFGSSLNPRAAVIFRPYARGNTKIIAAKAFRAPSIYELYYNDGGLTQVQSPNLDPEELYSLEVEHSHRFSPSLVATVSVYGNYVTHLISTLGGGTEADPLRYQNETSPLLILGGEASLRREFRQGAMFAVSYGLAVANFLATDKAGDLISLAGASDKRSVENAPVHQASLKAVVPILSRALYAGSRISIEGPRYDRYETTGDPAQARSGGSAIWDIVLSGEEAHYGVHYALGVYNAFDFRYRVPVSSEFTQRSIEQSGRTFLASLDVKY